VLSVPAFAAAAVDIALALALVVPVPTVAIDAEVMVALDVTDPRVVEVIGVGSTGTGNEPVLLLIILLVIIPLLIILALIIVLPLMLGPDNVALGPDNVALVDGVITPDIIGTVEVVPRMAEGVGMLVVVPRMAEGVGIIVVLPGPTMSVRVGRVVTPDTAPIAPHEAEAHTVQLCIMR